MKEYSPLSVISIKTLTVIFHGQASELDDINAELSQVSLLYSDIYLIYFCLRKLSDRRWYYNLWYRYKNKGDHALVTDLSSQRVFTANEKNLPHNFQYYNFAFWSVSHLECQNRTNSCRYLTCKNFTAFKLAKFLCYNVLKLRMMHFFFKMN